MSMGPSSPIHHEKAVNGWNTDIKRLAVSKPRILPPRRCFCRSGKALRVSYCLSDHLSTISDGAIRRLGSVECDKTTSITAFLIIIEGPSSIFRLLGGCSSDSQGESRVPRAMTSQGGLQRILRIYEVLEDAIYSLLDDRIRFVDLWSRVGGVI